MTLTPEEIARLKLLMEKATDAPWYTSPNDHPEIARATGGGGVLCGSYHDANVGTANVDLAVSLRNAAPSLLAAADRCERWDSVLLALGEFWKEDASSPSCRPTPLVMENALLNVVSKLTAAESRATQAEARVRELEGRLAAREQDTVDQTLEIHTLTTRLAAAREGLEKILSGIEPYPGDIARDTLARIGGEA